MIANKRRNGCARRRLGAIEREILDDLSGGDLLYGFLLSARSTRRMFKLARERATYRYRRKCAIERLKDAQFVQQRGNRLAITEAGAGALGGAVSATAALLKKRAPWDRRWRMVVFDIPEKYRRLRNQVRGILKRAGFKQLQQSVWIFPYECEELVQLIQRESELAPHILYGVLERIEGEKGLMRQFGLK